MPCGCPLTPFYKRWAQPLECPPARANMSSVGMPKHFLLQRSALGHKQAVLTRTQLFAGGLADVLKVLTTKSASTSLKHQRSVITAEKSHKRFTLTAEPFCQHQSPSEGHLDPIHQKHAEEQLHT